VKRRRASVIVLLLACACGREGAPRPQALVLVDTDLELPRLADHLELTLLTETQTDGGASSLVEACEGCIRQVDLEGDRALPISFGVNPEGLDGPVFARATLHLAGRSGSTGAWAETSIDRIVRLSFRSGNSLQSLFLPASCAGYPSDESSLRSCVDGYDAAIMDASPLSHAPPSRVGTFGTALPQECPQGAGAPRDAICITGGGYWMGDYRRVGLGRARDAWPEHLVAVRGFYLDRDEFTVGRYRAAVDHGFDGGALPTPDETNTDLPATHCNLTRAAADSYPLNCVSRDLAAALCRFEGGRLPSEAEWEWAAGGRELELLFPGGSEPPPCATDSACQRSAETPPELSPSLPVGSYRQDQSYDGLVDIAGNVAEWTRDDFEPYSGECWRPGAPNMDPVCQSPASGLASVRGGSARHTLQPHARGGR